MATLILRPNAVGAETNLDSSEATNWEAVDDETPDESGSLVYLTSIDSWDRDLYNLPALSGLGAINKITLYFRVRSAEDQLNVKGAIRSNSTVSETAEKNPYSDFGNFVWDTYSQEWSTNPADSEAWEWSDIDALQIGISLKRFSAASVQCTQVYVEVDYTPETPTNVSATKGDYTNKVVITWTKVSGAVAYKVYRDDMDISGWLGDVDIYDDETADAPIITPGDAEATHGKYSQCVALSISNEQVNNGTTHIYYVIGKNVYGGESNPSDPDTGFRGTTGVLSYQWQRSVADSNAGYSNITGALTKTYLDTDAPAYPAGRYYRCVLNSTDAVEATTDGVRGYRKSPDAPINQIDIIIKNPDEETLAYVVNAACSYDYRVNELGTFQFRVPSDDQAVEYLIYPNEAWLYIDGQFKNAFKIIRTRGER